jgi:lipid-A-disaccharide synthase
MLIAGEPSGDTLAAELVTALRNQALKVSSVPTKDVQPLRTALAPEFFGAGGPDMAAAGVELAFDLTKHSVLGVSDVLKNLLHFRRLFRQLLRLAIERQPDVIIGVDYGGLNLRFARAVRQHIRARLGWFHAWNPRIVQYVSPQVWASRPGRAALMEENHDLLVSLFPFERDWYARHAPKLRVEFVGHPLVERLQNATRGARHAEPEASPSSTLHPASSPRVVLLPGSRRDEVRRHWPLVTGALALLRRVIPELRATLVLPNEALAESAKVLGVPDGVELRIGGGASALAGADVAITKSGTITLECACFGLPAVVFLKTSWPNYWIGKQVVKVRHLAMPNLLAGEEIFPEFIQHAATPENLAGAALDLLRDASRRDAVKAKLARIVPTLGGPGASSRAAAAILRCLTGG